MNPASCGIWEHLEQNVYRGRRITGVQSLKENIAEDCHEIPLKIIDKCIDAFKRRLQLSRKSGCKTILIIDNSHRYISICISKIWFDFDQ